MPLENNRLACLFEQLCRFNRADHTAVTTRATLVLVVSALLPINANATNTSGAILVQSTTSTANSGLYDALLPAFQAETGIKANVVAVGTGQAIMNAKNCDADVLLVHAKSSEQAFVEEGYGVDRFDLMYNDFIIVGPENDPADINASKDAAEALRKIAQSKALFASRGDDSGTHKKEISLWSEAGIDPLKGSRKWYRDTGSGMGATLNVGVGMGAYVLTDRATWDAILFNQYGVIAVNPAKCPNVNIEAAETFIEWLLSDTGQASINAYQLDGQQLFFANGSAYQQAPK